jgi:hypothetical protein
MSTVELNNTQFDILDRFKELVSDIPGFEPFTTELLRSFLRNDSQFSLSFHKVKGDGILYGLDHADCRRQLINTIEDGSRKQILFRKLSNAGVFLDSKSPLHKLTYDDILSIGDIGMGHSVYVVETINGSWVVKEGIDDAQQFYEQLMSLLDWPTLHLYPINHNERSFSVFKYLGGQNLNKYTQDKGLDKSLEKQLAQQTALADFFGRGDRHFENYMVFEEQLYPIDVSFLFWENNEGWLSTYVNAGMAEFSYFSLVDNDSFLPKIETFFLEYKAISDLLKCNFESIELLIKSFYGAKSQAFIHYIKDRLYSDSYIDSQKELYMDGLSVCKKRDAFKVQLTQLAKHCPNVFKENPFLKMYYLADKGRHTKFFLSEKFGREVTVFSSITKLSALTKVLS